MEPEPHDEAMEALGSGLFHTCLSPTILHMFHKCCKIPAEETTRSGSHSALLATGVLTMQGAIDTTLLPEGVNPESNEFYHIFSILCQQSYSFWRAEEEFVQLLRDPSEVVYLSLKYSTLLENEIIGLVGKKAMMLKDALHHDALNTSLHPLVIDFLKLLFLPQGLNFRNIIWHGFTAPDEVKPALCTILIALHKTVCTVSKKVIVSTASNVSCDNLPRLAIHSKSQGDFTGHDSFIMPFQQLNLPTFDPQGATTCPYNLFLNDSFFVLPGREKIVISAIKDLVNGKPIACLMKLIPCLEHSLRMLFCLSNETNPYIMADVGVYYSTLDGFGQRSKHQLLLDPYYFDYNRNLGTYTRLGDNNLLALLGDGLYSLLVDLFFAETGPNVRARLAHGINIKYDENENADLLTENACVDSNRGIANVVVSLFLSLSMTFYRYNKPIILPNDQNYKVQELPSFDSYPVGKEDSGVKSKAELEFNARLLSSHAICSQWQSIYHPNRILARFLQDDAVPSLFVLSDLIQKRNFLCLSAAGLEEERINTSSHSSICVKIFCRRRFISDSDRTVSQELMSEISDKRGKILSNFLFVGDVLDNKSSSSCVTTVGFPGSDVVRSKVSAKSIGSLSHDVIQSCSKLTEVIVAAVTRQAMECVDHSARTMIIDILLCFQTLTTQGIPVQCHECFSPICSLMTADEENINIPNFDNFNSLLDIFLKKYCKTSSISIQGLSCCYTFLKVSLSVLLFIPNIFSPCVFTLL